MTSRRLSRRATLSALLGVGGLVCLPEGASFARGRTAPGGRVSLRVPWPLDKLDPHDGASAASALFADAVFDTLYARDESGALVPSLAESEPELSGNEVRVTVRQGLKTGRGRSIGARECAASIARARNGHARAWLADVPAPRVDGPVLRFASKDPVRIVRALASPVVAMVPAGFSPESPDGTGPFRLAARAETWTFTRNPSAARGASFLDELTVHKAQDLKASLRAFESGADDLGWLGMGLYEPRAGARAFDAGAAAYAVLFVGRDAGSWDAPGLAQRICDSVPPSRLAELSVGPAWTVEPGDGWGGPASPLLVREDSPYLVELARTVAGVLSRPGHEITVKPVTADELQQKRASRLFSLALDVVRPVAHGSLGALVALTQASDPGRGAELVLHPPRLGEVSPRSLTRTLRCGVLGEVRAQGGRVADLVLPVSSAAGGIDWGGVARVRRP